MQWEDDGIVIGNRPYGDRQMIVTLLTRHHGKASGMIRRSAQNRGHAFFPGTVVSVVWKGRLVEHVGSFSLEVKSIQTQWLQDPLGFSIFQAMADLLRDSVQDKDPHTDLFEETLGLVQESLKYALHSYAIWELHLLHHLGFGLDLSRCAVTQKTTDLAYISPKTGRAVSPEGAQGYAHRLLPFPVMFQKEHDAVSREQIIEALSVTQYFLEHFVFLPHGRSLPATRHSLKDFCESAR